MSSGRLASLWAHQLRVSPLVQSQLATQRAHLSSTILQTPVSCSFAQASRNAAPSTTSLPSPCALTSPLSRSRNPSSTPSSARTYSQSPARLLKVVSPRPGTAAEVYVAYGMTQKLFEACSNQADYKIPQVSQKGVPVPKTDGGEDLGVGESWWFKELGLLPTFSTWSQVTFLHMYLLTVRLRALPSPESVQTYSRHLIDHFSHNAEHRMDVLHDLGSRTIRNKYLKDLFVQWRGVLAAYDEGLVKGDAVLGAAVWRNLFKASPTGPDGKDIDWTKIAWVVAYMRRVLAELSKVNEADLAFTLGRGGGKDSGIFGYSEKDRKLVEAAK